MTLLAWSLDIAAYDSRGNSLFLTTLLKSKGLSLGSYDGRVTAYRTGIAGKIDPNSGGNDPTMTAVTGVYTTMWNTYLNEQLKFTSTFVVHRPQRSGVPQLGFQAHDPTGAQKGIDSKGNIILYTAGDLAAVMALNVDLKVLSANGLYDFVTPFYQTVLDLQQMPSHRQDGAAEPVGDVLSVGAHGLSRRRIAHALKTDLAKMYEAATSNHVAMSRIIALQQMTASKKVE